MRGQRRWITAAALGVILLLAGNCGGQKSRDPDDQGDTPPPDDTDPTLPKSPADWSGEQDWQGSAWEIVDE